MTQNNNLKAAQTEKPDPEVSEKRARRTFTAKYKLKVLEEIDKLTDSGKIGSFLRGEGLYSSHITTWARQREQGLLRGLAPKKRGRKKKEVNPLADKLARLERENKRLQEKLRKAETILEVQKNFRIDGAPNGEAVSTRNDVIEAVKSLAIEVGVKAACNAFCLPRASFYRHTQPKR